MTDREITPEDFVEALGMSQEEIELCTKNSIFTIRQLAKAADGGFEDDVTQLRHYMQLAQFAVDDYSAPEKVEEKQIWASTYISDITFNQIYRDEGYKSPYVLFHEFVKCRTESREYHPWKTIYYSRSEKNGRILQSDLDVFSQLIWEGTQSIIGRYDTTAGARAIPFLYSWLPGDLHGSALTIDRIISKELNNPFVSDRYAYPVAIDLTRLCQHYDAKLYHLNLNEEWQPLPLSSIPSLSSHFPDAFHSFNPGQDLFDSIPHGCIVTPTGIIPKECMKIFPKKEPKLETFDVSRY